MASSTTSDPRLQNLLRTLEEDPGDTPAFRTLEEELFVSGDWHQLAVIYKGRLAGLKPEHPERPQLLLRLADLLAERLDSAEAARPHYESLLRADPANAPALGGLRRVQVRLGNLTAALQIAELEEALQLPRRDKAQVLAEIGELWRVVGDAGEARRYFDEALRGVPESDTALAGLAGLHADEGDIRAAVALHERRLQGLRGSARSDAMEELATLLPAGEFERARSLLRDVIFADPTRLGALRKLLDIELEQRNWEAVEELEVALWDASGDDVERAQIALRAATRAIDELGNQAAGSLWLQRAALVAPREPEVQQLRARVSRRRGDSDSLIDALEKLEDLEGPSTMRKLEIAVLHETADRPELAIEHLRRLLDDSPDDAEALDVLDRCLERAGDPAGRIEVLERKLAAADDDREAAHLWVQLGELHLQVDATAEADRAFRQALQRDPSFGLADDHLRELLRKTERWDELASLLERDVETAEPGAERARRLCKLAELCLGSLDDPQRAQQGFMRALETDPSCSAALRGLRTAARLAGDLDALSDACERELSREPSDERRSELLRDLLAAAREAGDRTRARAVAERWASLDADPEAACVLVELAQEEGDSTAEIAALESLETVLPPVGEQRAAVLLRLGDLTLATPAEGARDVAARWYREALDAWPASPAREKLAELCRTAGWRPELAEHLRGLLEHRGESRELRIELARVLAELGDFRGATDAILPAFEAAPDDRGVADLLESLLAEQDRIEELTRVLGRRLEGEREPARRRELAHRLGGLLLDGLSRPVDAVSALRELADPSRHDGLEHLFERALEAAGSATHREHETWLSTREHHVDPSQRLDLLLCLARLQQEGGRLEEAIDSLRRAERLAPRNRLELVHGPLLALVREQGDPQAQLDLLSRLLEDAEEPSTQAAFRIERARILLDALDQPQQALDELGALDETSLGVTELRLIAGLYARANAIERRIATLDRLVASVREPADQLQVGLELSELLANGALEVRDEPRAEAMLRWLLEAHPDETRVFDRLSVLLERSGQQRAHADLLSARLERDDLPPPLRVSLSLQLARLLGELGDAEAAVDLLEAARQRTPAPTLDEALLHGLERTGRLDRRIELCAEKSATGGPEQVRWLRRWLDALESRGDGAEPRLAVVERLLAVDTSPSLRVLRVALLRSLGRAADLADALEELLLQRKAVTGGQRRGLVRELLRACEGDLADPARALALIEREVGEDPSLAARGARLASQLGESAREAALLAPRVAAMQDGARPDEVRQLALAYMACDAAPEAEPLLWRALDAHPRDRDVLDALETILRARDDAPGLLKLLDAHFQLESGERRATIAREGARLSARAADAEGELGWIRRRHALEALTQVDCERWLDLERQAGHDAGTLQALTELREQASDPQDQARLLAEEAAIRVRFGQLDLARRQYEQAIGALDHPPAEWLQALDTILDAQGRSAERSGVLSELSRHPGLSARERIRHQEAHIALLAANPDKRQEAVEQLRALLDADGDAKTRADRRRQLLDLYDGLEWPTAWCELAESLLPSLEGEAAQELEREIARRMGQELGAPELAIERWRSILDQQSDDLEALAALAELLDAPGREADRAEVLELYAAGGALDVAEVWLEAARLRWTFLRDSGAALQDLDAALSERPDLAEAHELRCEISAHLGDQPVEIESLRALLESNPHARSAADRWLRLAELLIDTPTADSARARREAGEAAAAVLTSSPQLDASVRVRVRRVFEQCGEWRRAAQLLGDEIQVANEVEQPALLRRLLRVQWDELREAEEAARTFATLAEIDSLDADEFESRAEVLAALERWPEALAQREKALELREEVSAGDWLDLARDWMARADSADDAVRACGRALGRDAGSIAALELRAELCGRSGRPADELDDRVRLGDLHTDEVRAAEAIATAAAIARTSLGDPTRAGSLFRNALKRDASNVAALEGAGQIALERSEWSEAERLLGMASALLEGDPRRAAEAARGAAEGALQQSRHADAFHHLERALDHDPDHAETLDRMAEVALQLGAHDRARACLEKRLEQPGLDDTERAERMAKLAQAREGTGDASGAAELLEAALELRPGDEVARAHVVDLLESEGHHARALEQVGAWLDATAAEFRPKLELRAARLEKAAGRRPDARARLETLLEGAEPPVEAWIELATLTFEDDEAGRALDVAERGLPRVSDSGRAALLWLKAQALQKLGRMGEAARAACESLCAEPTNVDAARLLARNMGQSGEFQASVTELERVLDASSPDAAIEAELWESIGRAYAGPLENVERAERAYRRALAANPARTAAREALADITAFDPGSHQASVQLHRELLAKLPARESSWRALLRIAEHWERTPPAQTCTLVLQTLGHRTESPPLGDQLPLLRPGPNWSPAIRAGLELLSSREDAELLPTSQRAPDTGESAALRAELSKLAGRSWSLSDEQIRELWRRPVDEASLTVEGVARKSRKRLRKSLRAFDPAPLRGLDVETWREALLCEAAARAVLSRSLPLRDALLDLLTCWPATRRLDVRNGGDLGSALQLCDPARALLLRVADATLAGLGL